LLWGLAQKKAAFVDGKRHLVLKAPHPFSAAVRHNGFFSVAATFRRRMISSRAGSIRSLAAARLGPPSSV
jgi:uracil DNA glycosylase